MTEEVRIVSLKEQKRKQKITKLQDEKKKIQRNRQKEAKTPQGRKRQKEFRAKFGDKKQERIDTINEKLTKLRKKAIFTKELEKLMKKRDDILDTIVEKPLVATTERGRDKELVTRMKATKIPRIDRAITKIGALQTKLEKTEIGKSKFIIEVIKDLIADLL